MNEKILESVEQQLQNELDDKIAEVRKQAVVTVPENFDGNCEECDMPIPQGRLRTGAVTCIECQRFIEANDKRLRQKRKYEREE